MLPKAREEDLIVRELADETMVYDLKRNKAHCLNRTAALVWRHCDGRTDMKALAAVLQKEIHVRVDEGVVSHTLDRLQKAHLLTERFAVPKNGERVSRRDVIRKLGAAAALAPLVLSVLAPTAAQACSAGPGCIAKNGACSLLNDTCCCPCTCQNVGGNVKCTGC